MMPGQAGNAHRKDLGFRYEVTGAQSAPYENFTVVCHSEEYSDEESAFDFSVLVERIGKKPKQMLHFVQHDRTANSERPEGFVSLGGLSTRSGHALRFCASHTPIWLPLSGAGSL
jgi:hypothetical protein